LGEGNLVGLWGRTGKKKKRDGKEGKKPEISELHSKNLNYYQQSQGIKYLGNFIHL
jgi:hypothetical protein